MMSRQRIELRKHLEKELTKRECDLVMQTLILVLASYTKFGKPTQVTLVPRMKALQKYMKRVRAAVADLRELLEERTGYLPRKFDRKPLLAALNALDAVAWQREKEDPRRKGRGGRYKDLAKSQLIKSVYEAYPNEKAKKGTGSNFEVTVEKLLRFANEPSEDIHSIIMRALPKKKKFAPESATKIFARRREQAQAESMKPEK